MNDVRRMLLKAAAGLVTAMIPAGGAAGVKGDSCGCRRIDVHSHYLPEPYQQALAEAGLAQVDGGMPLPAWSAADHLAMMDASNIRTSILSISSPGMQFLGRARAAHVARLTNAAGAAVVRAHPDRFGMFATLPMEDVDDAIAEVAHALDHLGADGISLETNVRGIYPGDPRYARLLDELDRRSAVVLLHPTSPACLAQIGMGYPGPMIEFPFDTVRSIVDLIFSGAFARRPNIRMILSHGGGVLGDVVTRLSMMAESPMIKPRPVGGAREWRQQIARLHFDLALSATPARVASLVEIAGVDHLLYGSDYPFAPPPAIAANDRGWTAALAGLSPREQAMLDYDNALRLFPRLALGAA